MKQADCDDLLAVKLQYFELFGKGTLCINNYYLFEVLFKTNQKLKMSEGSSSNFNLQIKVCVETIKLNQANVS